MLTIHLVIALDKKLSDQVDAILAFLTPIDTSKLDAASKRLETETGTLTDVVTKNQ